MPEQRAARAPSPETETTPHGSAGRTTPAADSPSPQDGNLQPSVTPENTQQPSDKPDRAGVDARQRGWYWHWNGIVTQYAPLIGLKGVGLLNSYTVWTDRRDQSPTRGYAFPSQQSEAAFYGEDRAELITINKILVALDLIEIRKEMVQRIDPQGRKWKVPHNLYRVKDRPEGIELRTEDVLRVAELASRDAAVYRYVKRMFSSRFAPIDRENVWHRILEEVAGNPTWQQLTEKTARTEARASARTRAGHKSRNKTGSGSGEEIILAAEMTAGQSSDGVLPDSEHHQSANGRDGTSVAHTNNGSGTKNSVVADSNNGSEPDVGSTNRGSQGGDESSAEATNNGPASVVERSNATHYQETSTTTTTTNESGFTGTNHREPDHHVANSTPSAPSEIEQHDEDTFPESPRPDGLDHDSSTLQGAAASRAHGSGSGPDERRLADPAAGGPLVDPGPLVVSLFEAANNRPASPLERILLGELERDAAVPAGRAGESGADWVAAALREAVSSGSAFVAPKRIREIINRWAALGSRPDAPPATPGVDAPATTHVRLPRNRNAGKVWQAVLDDFARVLQPDACRRLFEESRIVGYHRGEVVIQVSSASVSKLEGEYHPMLLRYLGKQLGTEVRVRFEPLDMDVRHDVEQPAQEGAEANVMVISRHDAEQARQLWRAVLHETDSTINGDDRARIAGSMPLGQDPDGRIVIGASTSLAARLIDGRCREAIELALQSVLGGPCGIRVVPRSAWIVEEDEDE